MYTQQLRDIQGAHESSENILGNFSRRRTPLLMTCYLLDNELLVCGYSTADYALRKAGGSGGMNNWKGAPESRIRTLSWNS
jgi:hypothetical protein